MKKHYKTTKFSDLLFIVFTLLLGFSQMAQKADKGFVKQQDLIFFKGDSLNGFPIENEFIKCQKLAQSPGALYEYKYLLKRREAKFVKQKYHIDKLPYEIAQEKLREQNTKQIITQQKQQLYRKNNPPTPLASSCNNIDFEDGNFTNWVGYEGYNEGTNNPLTTVVGPIGPPPTNLNSAETSCNYFSIISNGSTDPNTGIVLTSPLGGNCARMGGENRNLADQFTQAGTTYYYCTGNNSGTFNYTIPSQCVANYFSTNSGQTVNVGEQLELDASVGEVLETTFTVTTQNSAFQYSYLFAYTDNGDHDTTQQPYFKVRVLDQNGNEINCLNYFQQGLGNGCGVTHAPPGYAGGGGLYYTSSWQTSSLNLLPYMGQPITVQFTVAGCIVGGHFGYAYVDCACQPQQIIIPFTACEGGNTSLIAPPLGNAVFQWTTPNGNIVSGSTNDTVVVNQSGTYSVTITPTKSSVNSAGNVVTETLTSCSYKLDTTITLFPNPTVTVNSMSVCAGGTATLTAASTGSAGTLNYTWNPAAGFTFAAGDSSGTIIPASTGSYTVTGTSVHNCTNTAVATVTVNPSPPPTFTAPTVCLGSATNFTNTTAGGSTYSWAFGDGVGTSTLENPSYTYTAASNYAVSLTVTTASGCVANGTQTVAVISNPTVSFSVNPVCLGVASSFTTATTPTAGLNYSWDFGDAGTSTVNNPTHTYATDNTYNVTLTVTIGSCTAVATNTALVTPNPTASFTVGPVCEGTASFFDASASTPTVGATYNWSFGGAAPNTATVTTPTDNHTYSASGTFPVTLIVLVGTCTATATGNAVVNTFPVLGFTVDHPCDGTAANFVNTTANQGTITNWDWNFGDGSADATTATPPAHTYPATNCYTAVLTATATTGCSGTFSTTVNIHPNPVADFNALEACLGTTSDFMDASSVTNPGCLNDQLTSWQWSYGDGQTSTNTVFADTVKHTYAACGPYNITLTVTTNNNCTNTVTLTGDTVYCIPSVAVLPGFTVCPGAVTPQQTFTTTCTNGGTPYAAWLQSLKTPPSNNTGAPPFFTTTGGINVVPSYTAVAQNTTCNILQDTVYAVAVSGAGCVGNAVYYTANVFPTPTVTPVADITVCANQPVNVPAFAGCPTPETFTWSTTAQSGGNIGVAATGTGNVAPFTGTNTANVPAVTTLSITPMANGCVGTPSGFSITVNPIPAMTAVGSTVCPGDIVPQPTIVTNPANPAAGVTYNWTVTNLAGNIGMPVSGTGTPAQYTAAATNMTGSNEIGVITYTPALNGCVGLPTTDTVNIKPTPVVNMVPSPAYCPNDSTTPINFACSPAGGVPIFHWQGSSGLGGMQTGNLPSFLTNNNTNTTLVTTFSVNATLNSCPGPFSTFSITVYPNPVASFTATPACFDSLTHFTNTSTVGGGFTVNSYTWNFGNFQTSNSQNPSQVIKPVGTDPVSLIVASSSAPSCTATVTNTVVVNPNPVANFTGVNLIGCPNIYPTFTNLSTISTGSIVSWTWNFLGNVGQPVMQVGPGPLSETYTNMSNTMPAYYNVSLTVTSAAGCSSTLPKSNYIEVYPNPVADFSWGPSDADINSPVITFANQAQGYAPYSGGSNPPVYVYGQYGVEYSLGDNLATNSNPNTVYNASGFTHSYNNPDLADVQETYTVTQWVVNSYGCTDSITKPVIINPIFTFYIPNAFTPNGDGKNEGFKGIGEGIDNSTYNMWVFDRWGMMIYYTSDLNQVWDGHMRGDEGRPILQEDVYVWKVKFNDAITHAEHEYHGTVTLIK